MAIQQLNNVDPAFPQRLQQLHKPPKQLFVRGNLRVGRPLVAVIGSRRPSNYGKIVAEKLSRELTEAGIGIVSGLALGIDAIAHQACLDAGGYTIAVLAHGLDTINPVRNFRLGEQVEKHGALVSEYPIGHPAIPSNFIERNRIVAGLADGILVIEATKRSGTTSTARFGLELGREVMAVPGSIQSVLSEGTNNLIKAGAHPITEVTDIFSVLGIEHKNNDDAGFSTASAAEKSIIKAIKNNQHSGEELLNTSKLSHSEFMSTLTDLELKGIIRPAGGNNWFLR